MLYLPICMRLRGGLACLLPRIIKIFKHQNDQRDEDSRKNDNEHSADVLYGNAIGLIVDRGAVLLFRVLVPPLFFEGLQFPLIEELENTKFENVIELCRAGIPTLS